MDLTGGS